MRIFGLTSALLLLLAIAPAFAQSGASPEVEKAYASSIDTVGPVPKALHHVSEHRFLYSAGFFAVSLLILFSVSKLVARRIFGTLSVVGLLMVLHYLFIGIAVPSLRADEWEGPVTRGMGIRSVKEWKRVPDIGTYFRVVRERNFMGPKNKTPLSAFYSDVIADQTGGKEASVGYGQEFVTQGIKWKPGSAKILKDGRMMYFWCAEFKQQRVVIVLSVAPGSRDADKDLAEITTLVGNIR